MMEDSRELDELVRMSWEEPQDTAGGVPGSPISTPVNLNKTGVSGTATTVDKDGDSVTNGKTDEYRLLKHHYNFNAEEDVGNGNMDLIRNATEEKKTNNVNDQEIRRGSLHEAQRSLQMLNPRSSFSGMQNLRDESQLENDKRWVTVLYSDSEADLKTIVVLNQSLRQVQSKYGLTVVVGQESRCSMALKNLGITTICASESTRQLLSVDGKTIHPSLLKMALLLTVQDTFDMVCYLEPSLMAVQNADELLAAPEVCTEIDNETCVLLTNTPDTDLQFAVMRPTTEIAMCIREYLTVYGPDTASKSQKLTSQSDTQMLQSLFADAWAHISSTEYTQRLDPQQLQNTQITAKFLDYSLLKPWNLEPTDPLLNNSLYGTWYHSWHNATKK